MTLNAPPKKINTDGLRHCIHQSVAALNSIHRVRRGLAANLIPVAAFRLGIRHGGWQDKPPSNVRRLVGRPVACEDYVPLQAGG